MSKEKDLLKEILANTRVIMEHLKLSSTVSPVKGPVKAKSPVKKPGTKRSK